MIGGEKSISGAPHAPIVAARQFNYLLQTLVQRNYITISNKSIFLELGWAYGKFSWCGRITSRLYEARTSQRSFPTHDTIRPGPNAVAEVILIDRAIMRVADKENMQELSTDTHLHLLGMVINFSAVHESALSWRDAKSFIQFHLSQLVKNAREL